MVLKVHMLNSILMYNVKRCFIFDTSLHVLFDVNMRFADYDDAF
jgi:hypothetical protein